MRTAAVSLCTLKPEKKCRSGRSSASKARSPGHVALETPQAESEPLVLHQVVEPLPVNNQLWSESWPAEVKSSATILKRHPATLLLKTIAIRGIEEGEVGFQIRNLFALLSCFAAA